MIDRIGDEGAAVTTKTVQAIPLAGLLAHCRAVADGWPERDFGAPRLADDDYEGLHLFSEPAGRGRRRSNAFYWQVAHGYLVLQSRRLANVSEADEFRRESETRRRMRGLLSELAERLAPLNGGKQPSREEVRDWVHRARVLKLLTESAPGEAGANTGSDFEAVYQAEVWPRLRAGFRESESARRAELVAAAEPNEGQPTNPRGKPE